MSHLPLSQITLLLSLLTPCIFSSALPQTQHPLTTPTEEHTNYLFVFGNSYTSVGFHPAWGQPRIGNPIGNPTFPGSNIAGGKNYVGYLTADYNASLTFTYDFAFNCATVSKDLVPDCGAGVRSLVDQVDAYVDLDGDWGKGNALFVIWFGINDVDLPTKWEGEVDHRALHQAVVNRYFAEVKRLYDHGARNIVLLGVPPIDRTPGVRNRGPQGQEFEKEMRDDFNVRLKQGVKGFGKEYTDAAVVMIDTVTVFGTVLDHPQEFGARDEFCFGGYDDGCLWGDIFHPGRILHEFLARNIVKALEGRIGGFFEPNW